MAWERCPVESITCALMVADPTPQDLLIVSVTVLRAAVLKWTVSSAAARAGLGPGHGPVLAPSRLVAKRVNGNSMTPPTVQAHPPLRFVTELFPSGMAGFGPSSSVSSPGPHAATLNRPRLHVPAVTRSDRIKIGLKITNVSSANLPGKATLVARTMKLL